MKADMVRRILQLAASKIQENEQHLQAGIIEALAHIPDSNIFDHFVREESPHSRRRICAVMISAVTDGSRFFQQICLSPSGRGQGEGRRICDLLCGLVRCCSAAYQPKS